MDGGHLVASSHRPLRIRARRDLIIQRQSFQGRACWVIKDPLTLKFFRFEEEEFAILQLLDGHKPTAEILEEFHSRFAPCRLTHDELMHLVGTLHRSGLVISDNPGQGAALWRRGRKRLRQQARQHWISVLSWRFRGIDPDRFLTSLSRYSGWLFSWPMACTALLFVLAAIAIVLTNWGEFYQKLPTFREFFAGSNWFWLAVALSGTKVIHELGHGLACKRFGSQCHELGVMFLVFTPCLYCNVSDSWLLSDKWRRMAISAAGMYVELLVAALATFVWWFSEPGLVHQLALNIMFVSSVSTLLFNANPLMRFDGYYLLSDWTEIPNLRQKATSWMQRLAAQRILGLELPPDPFLPNRHRCLFAVYAIGTIVYRWVITWSIIWFLYHVLEPYGLRIIGQGLAAIAFYSLIGMPIHQLVTYFRVPGRWPAVKKKRAGLAVATIAVIVACVLVFPLPHYVRCACFVEVADAQSVFVERGGTLAEVFIEPNTYVDAGEPVCRLASPELVRELRRMEGEIRAAAASYQTQLNLSQVNALARQHVNSALTAHNVAVDRFEQRLQDLPRLTVTAPCAGWLISPPSRPSPTDADALATWTGRPLDPRNVGAYLEPQTLVAVIAPDPTKLHCYLAIDQADIEFVAVGQEVNIWLNQRRADIHAGQIASISLSKMRDAPLGLSHRYGGELTTETSDGGREVPVSATYPALVKLNVEEWHYLQGATGTARIRVGSRTIAHRLWRGFCQTFRFDLK